MLHFFKGFKEGFHDFGMMVASLVNTIILSFLYFVGIGLIYISSKITGKAYLDMGKEKKKSYWKSHEDCRQPIGKYYRQF